MLNSTRRMSKEMDYLQSLIANHELKMHLRPAEQKDGRTNLSSIPTNQSLSSHESCDVAMDGYLPNVETGLQLHPLPLPACHFQSNPCGQYRTQQYPCLMKGPEMGKND